MVIQSETLGWRVKKYLTQKELKPIMNMNEKEMRKELRKLREDYMSLVLELGAVERQLFLTTGKLMLLNKGNNHHNFKNMVIGNNKLWNKTVDVLLR